MSKIAESVRVTPTEFHVDGKPFPWYISEKGPTITELPCQLYVVEVEILCIENPGAAYLPLTTEGDNDLWPTPIIGAVAFPWMITAEGWTFTTARKDAPTLRLAFFAEQVDDHRTRTDFYNFTGEIIRTVQQYR